MLLKLSIRNYVLISEAEIEFSPKFTVITGETGAGKTILLGALDLVLGERADTKVLFDSNEKCVVEAHFSIAGISEMKEFFSENELDFESHSIVRREISSAGKSRAFINDTPVNLSVLKKFSDRLVDLHRQQETGEIDTERFRIDLLDSLAGQTADAAQYRKLFADYKNLLAEIETLSNKNKEAAREKDYLEFQLSELETAALRDDEQPALEQEQTRLEHAEEIQRLLSAAAAGLSEGEQPATAQIKFALQSIRGAGKFLPELEALAARLESVWIELSDIASEISSLTESSTVDPARLAQVSERLDILYRLQKKHHVQTTAELISLLNEFSRKLAGISTAGDEETRLREQAAMLKKDLFRRAQHLSISRTAEAKRMELSLHDLLAEAGMPKAVFKTEIISAATEPAASGIDSVRMLFSANPGSPPQDLSRVASGGERSRLMLCLKSLAASSVAMPTLLFDEIDSGISGETALRVGAMMKKLSRHHQLICITHLPQIAGKGDAHLLVEKEIRQNKTFTRVRSLDQPERLKSIARMLSGEKPSSAALENARELMK